MWSEYLGSNILERAANTTWKRMTNFEGDAGRVTEALNQIFPEQIGDHQKLRNLLTAYELWFGHILTSPALVFVQDGLSSVLEPGWEVQLQQYRNGFVEKVRSGRDHHTDGQTATQIGKCGSRPPVDSFATEPSQADDDQHMAEPERGQLNLEGAAEVVNQAKVLSKKNMKMLRKRPGAPKYVRHFVKLISELAEEHDGSAQFGPVVKIWEVLLKCDEKGKKHLKDEEKIRRSREKERKKKEKRRARKKSEKARKSKKKKSSKSGKWSDSSTDSSSTSEWSSGSSSDDSSDTDSFSSGDRKERRGSGAERRSRPSQFEFRWINGKKHFRMRNGQWQDCSGPPSKECRYCGKRRWAFQAQEFGCR